jgi:RNA polymerase sigma factor for flagellar operon FliA
LNTLKDILGKIDLEEGYERLTKREKKIITLYYLEGYKDEEIAIFYGISRQIITRLRGKGITKLKKY